MIREINDIEKINNLLKKFNVNIKEIGVYSHCYIYEENDVCCGFLYFDYIYDRIEIEYIYVNEEKRQKGIASFLLEKLIDESKKLACLNITLEVNVNNVPAIKLYEKYGFKKVAVREKYYGSEDGLLMIREMN